MNRKYINIITPDFLQLIKQTNLPQHVLQINASGGQHALQPSLRARQSQTRDSFSVVNVL